MKWAPKPAPRNVLGTPDFAPVAQAKLNANLYPSVPIPQNNLDSIYQSILLMHHVLQLLTVNTQKTSTQLLTQTSQRFVKQSDHDSAITNLQNQLSNLQSQLTALQGGS